MANNDKQSRPPLRFMRLKDIVETSDEVISFVDKYQKVWEAEGKAMIALGEFLTLRSESMRYQVEMMKMGNDGFRRYNEWLEAIMSLRPDNILQALLRPPERGPSSTDTEKADEAT